MQHRDIQHKAPPQIALQQPAQKGQILPPKWLIQAVMANGRFPNILGCIRRNQHVNRISNGIDAKEDKRRHGQHDESRLNEALNDIPEH